MKLPDNWTYDEKLKLIQTNGWYQYYGDDNWRTSNMSEMGGCSFEGAFHLCFHEMLSKNQILQDEYFKLCHEKYLTNEK